MIVDRKKQNSIAGKAALAVCVGILLPGCASAFGDTMAETAAVETVGSEYDKMGSANETAAQTAQSLFSDRPFGFSMLQAVDANEKGNKMVSKASLDAVLRLAAIGTSDADLKGRICSYTDIDPNRDIAEQIRELEAANDASVLKSAYGIWANSEYSLKETFKEASESIRARITEFDAANKGEAMNDINSFIDENTGHMIQSIISSPDEINDLCLVNALYFNGKWQIPFKESNTHKDSFTRNDGQQMDADFMYETGSSYYEDDSFIAYEKKYEGGIYSFMAIMPKDEGMLDYDVSGIDFDRLDEGKKHAAEVRVYLPKFDFEWSGNLKETVEAAGLGDMFTDWRFDLMLEKECKVSSILQKTKVEVDEEGTRAAAATIADLAAATAIPPQPEDPVILRFNRPFVFVILNRNTGEHMFTGYVNSPIAILP